MFPMPFLPSAEPVEDVHDDTEQDHAAEHDVVERHDFNFGIVVPGALLQFL